MRAGGASARLSGASSTSSPSSSGDMMIWQHSREHSSTWKAQSSISSSSSVAAGSLGSHLSSTHTWQVAQAQAPPHSALMGSSQSRITSMTRQPSSASRRWEEPSGIRTTTNISGHLQQTLQLGRRGCVLETQRFVRMHVTTSGLRHKRSLMKPGKDELQLTGISIDVADGEDALAPGLEFLGVHRDQVLVEIEPEMRRPELHGEPEEGKQGVRWKLAGR